MLKEAAIPVKKKIESEFMIRRLHDGQQENERKRSPDYFRLIYLSEGGARYGPVGANVAATAPLLLMGREDIGHQWVFSPDADGFVLRVTKEFVERMGDRELKDLMGLIGGYHNLELVRKNHVGLLLEALMDEHGGQSRSSRVTVWILKAFLTRCMESVRSGKREHSGQNDLYVQFISLLKSQTNIKRQVQYYANILVTSSQNLNNACRKNVGRSASEVLGDFVAEEAKRYLLRTDRKVTEISGLLDFKDPSHFVKFFKRVTGATPQVFREKAG